MENKWKIIIGLLSIGLIVVGAISWIAYEKSSREPPIQDTSYLLEKLEENAREIEKVKLLGNEGTERDQKTIDRLLSMSERYYTVPKIISYDSNATDINVKFTFEGCGMILHSDEKTTHIELYWGWEDKEEIELLIENLEDQNDVVREAIRNKLEIYGFVSLTIAEPLPESIQHIRRIPQSYSPFNKETIRQLFREEKTVYWSEDVCAWIVVIREVPIIYTTREPPSVGKATSTVSITWVEEDDSEGIPHPEKTVFLTYPNTTAINYIEFRAKEDTLLEGVKYNEEYQVLYLSYSCEYYYILHYRYCGIYPEDLKLYSTDRPMEFEVYVYRILEVREHKARVYLEKSFIIHSEIGEDC
jgi:hypothetical protein